MKNRTKLTNRSDENQIIAKTEYKVSNVAFSSAVAALSFSEPILTWLPDGISDRNKVGISLQELEQRINAYNKQNQKGVKINNSGFLKGLYSGYYSGINCTTTAPLLCFDIDVKNSDKPEENPHLMNPVNNERVFDELKKISVLCWKSNSGYGIAGILHVPQMAQYTNDTRGKHLKAGKSITSFVSDYLYSTTGIRVVFDQAQSKFRQVRLIADQQGATRTLNKKPFGFTYKSEEVLKKTEIGVTNYRYSDYRLPENSIYSQFNNDNCILTTLQLHGFEAVKDSGSQLRVKHYTTSSTSSGLIDKEKNVYVNFSSSFDTSGKKIFSPSDIVCKAMFGYNWKRFREYLESMGYKDIPITQTKLDAASGSLKEELKGVSNEEEASKIIFKHCYNLRYESYEVKRRFIADNCTNPQFEKYFATHINFVDYRIKYDKKLLINSYVSEVLQQVLDFSDKHNKVLLRADTGRGKTTAFIKDFHKHRPNCRLLILVPLTIISDQNEKDYGDKVVFLTGQSDGFAHEKARKANIVLATYEQGTKHLAHHTFDYLVIDEAHQLIVANSFKANVIKELTALFKDSKVIGLTGTPSEIFSLLDYKLLDVDVEHPKQM